MTMVADFAVKTQTQTITVVECPDCIPVCECPTSITVTGPSAVTLINDSMTFTANVSGGTQNNTTFNWTVDKGTITSGQGTSTISVATNADIAGQTVTATVQVGGLCDQCTQNTASSTGEVQAEEKKPISRQLDEFGPLQADDLKVRLQNLQVELSNDPTATAYVITSGSGRAKTRQVNNIRTAIRFLRLDESRIRIVDGDASAPVGTVIWITPAGAEPPQ
ncbi:MAG: hypothetical protein HC846_14100 [Blastocatellia bacterium]|nr:hypothetical protein [Blastocatellia bacterium]